MKENQYVKNILYLEPFLIDHLAGVECTHGIYLHYCPEGIEGEGASWAEEVSSSICQIRQLDVTLFAKIRNKRKVLLDF